MKIDGRDITQIIIRDPKTNEPVLVIDDNGVTNPKGFLVSVVDNPGYIHENSVVTIGQLLAYKDSPEELWQVLSGNEESFIIRKLVIDPDTKKYTYSDTVRKLMNNKNYVTLEGLGLSRVEISRTEADGSADKESSPEKDCQGSHN